ncbi:unnamed protein product, partial [Discosporangium mesarthrocarpum]
DEEVVRDGQDGATANIAMKERGATASAIQEADIATMVRGLPVYLDLHSIVEEAQLLDRAQEHEGGIAEVTAVAAAVEAPGSAGNMVGRARKKKHEGEVGGGGAGEQGDKAVGRGQESCMAGPRRSLRRRASSSSSSSSPSSSSKPCPQPEDPAPADGFCGGQEGEGQVDRAISELLSARNRIWASCRGQGLSPVAGQKWSRGREHTSSTSSVVRSIYSSFGAWRFGVDKASLGWVEEHLLPEEDSPGDMGSMAVAGMKVWEGNNVSTGGAGGKGECGLPRRKMSKAEEALHRSAEQQRERARKRKLIAREQQERIDRKGAQQPWGLSRAPGAGGTRGGGSGVGTGVGMGGSSSRSGDIRCGVGGNGVGLKGRRAVRPAPLVRAVSMPKLSRGSLIHGKLVDSVSSRSRDGNSSGQQAPPSWSRNKGQ